MNIFDKLKVTIEKHIIKGKSTDVKKVYIEEKYFLSVNEAKLKECFRKELKAKKILKYEKDIYSFRWVVWYI